MSKEGSKVFTDSVQVLIGDTNMFGNVYWLKWLELFGKTREKFLFSLMPEGANPTELLQAMNVIIETASVEMKFKKSAFLGDKLVVNLVTNNFRKCSVNLHFEIILDNVDNPKESLIAFGSQTLVFMDPTTFKIAKIPDALKELAMMYEATSTPVMSKVSLNASS